MSTHRPLGSSFLGLPSRILNINHKKELLRGLWVGLRVSPRLSRQPEGFGSRAGTSSPETPA